MSRAVLFATDLSAENRVAFARAVRLAHEGGVQLDALHVLDEHLPRRVLHTLETAVVEDIAAILTDLREDYALPEPKTLLKTVAGSAYAEIIREAHERDAQLIVLGVHRKRGQPDLVAGTTLMRVLRGAPCPVVVASQLPTQDWNNILVPIDFSLTARHTLREALTRFPDAKLTLLHAWNLPGERELGSFSHYAKWREHEVARLRSHLEHEVNLLMEELAGVPEVELLLEQGEPCEVLMRHIRRDTPDLVIMGSRSQLNHHSHITATLLAEPHCDLMLCRAW
ncbi:universal stress protein [Halomonas sp. Bachu 37]|uniref:universal stress protein n=1 Tax=Halomonas kashgarensis TaxID=3084920 RepID=UPI0032168E83